jgi:hypothetical protein
VDRGRHALDYACHEQFTTKRDAVAYLVQYFYKK